jgi:hypothetical protein
VYASARDALITLLESSEGLNKITKSSPGIIRLKNGIKYFQVEVTSEDGVQYGISAYNEEAEELCRAARSAETELIITA